MDASNEEKWRLITENQPLLAYFVNKFGVPYSSPMFDDILSEVLLLAFKALNWYNPDKSKIATYFAMYFRHQIPLIIAKYKYPFDVSRKDLFNVPKVANDDVEDLSEKNIAFARGLNLPTVSLDSTVSDDNSISYADVIPDKAPSPFSQYFDSLIEVKQFEYIEMAANIFKEDKHRQIWFEFAYGNIFDDPPTQRYLASKYGYSQSYVARILIKAKNTFKKLLEAEDIV